MTTLANLQQQVTALRAAVHAQGSALSNTAESIRAELAADYAEITAQQTTDEALLASLLTEVYLTTTRAEQPVIVTNPNPDAVTVALLCITTNIGTPLRVPPMGTATFTDSQAGDSLRIVSFEPFTAALG